MIDVLYIEEAVRRHPRTERIRRRFPRAVEVPCERYGEVFNRRRQSFRLQKKRPALIVARKHDGFVLEAPAEYGLGGGNNFYFSHMLNCPYDCRYCFLQGMYRSANYVLFVNYEDFEEAIDERLRSTGEEECTFFSGYDCDSLAFEGVSGFGEHFLDFFAGRSRAWLELRTKSARVVPLLNRDPVPRCIVAFSFTPEKTSRALEHGVPSIARRVAAMAQLGERGWLLGLRFDPLVYEPDFRRHFQELLDVIFSSVRPQALHSVSFGTFRMPRTFFRNLQRQYPDEPLLAHPFSEERATVSYPRGLEQELLGSCKELLLDYVPPELVHPCVPKASAR